MASLDTNRPAAMEQLAILGNQIGVDTLPIVKGEDPVTIARRAKTQASLGGYDVYMLDTAGRLHIDEELIAQAAAVRDVANPARNSACCRWSDRSGRRECRHRIRRQDWCLGRCPDTDGW